MRWKHYISRYADWSLAFRLKTGENGTKIENFRWPL
jgi:hypothetical protein